MVVAYDGSLWWSLMVVAIGGPCWSLIVALVADGCHLWLWQIVVVCRILVGQLWYLLLVGGCGR